MTRPSWIIQVGLKSNDKCPYKTQGRFDRREGDMIMRQRLE